MNHQAQLLAIKKKLRKGPPDFPPDFGPPQRPNYPILHGKSFGSIEKKKQIENEKIQRSRVMKPTTDFPPRVLRKNVK